MNKEKLQPIEKIASTILLIFVALLPLLIIPFTNNFVFQSKALLIFVTALIIVVTFIIKSFRKQSWQISLNPISLPLFFMGASILASTFLTSPYPTSNLLGQGGVYISALVIALLAGSLLPAKIAEKFIKVLTISSIVLAITMLLQLVGWGPSKLISKISAYQLPDTLIFNLSGSSLIAAQIMTLNLVAIVAQIIRKKFISSLNLIAIPALLFGLGISIWSMLPGKVAQLTLSPIGANWSIALDNLRTARTALIGSGPESYVSVYKKFKPLWVNTKDYWQINFDTGSNTPMTHLITYGIIGLVSWILIVTQFFKPEVFKKLKKYPLTYVIAASFILQLLLPPNIVFMALQAVCIAFWAAELKKDYATLNLEALTASVTTAYSLDQPQKKKKQNWFLNIINFSVIALVAYIGFGISRSYMAYNQVYKASKAALNNDIVGVYNFQRKAIGLNKYLDYNRREFALTNLQIAMALSSKADATEQEKAQVVELVSNAISESRAAIALNPYNDNNHAVLGEIYKNLIGSAEGADQWTVNAYVDAISANPSNPLLRVELGNVLLGLEQYNEAANLFAQAIDLKPELPVGYYQLGRTLAIAGSFEQAKQAWQQTLTLLPADSEDYKAVQENLAALEEKILEAQAAAEQAPAGQGTAPSGSQIPSITEQTIGQPQEEAVSNPETTPLQLDETSTESVNTAPAEEQSPADINTEPVVTEEVVE
jgi:tetratricopeptide (TPR) repeat protein